MAYIMGAYVGEHCGEWKWDADSDYVGRHRRPEFIPVLSREFPASHYEYLDTDELAAP